MIFRDEDAFEDALYHFALEAAGLLDPPSDPDQTAALVVDDLAGVSLLTLARAAGAINGRKLFVALARRRALTLEEDAWDGLPDGARGFFRCLARLVSAFAEADGAEAAEPRTLVVQAGRPKLRDTIFERTEASDRSFEKTGGADLAPGQPTSSGEVHVEIPTFAAPGAAIPPDAMAERMRAMGFSPPLGPDGEDERRFAAEVNGRLEAELGPAPAPAPFVRRRVQAFADGVQVAGEVFISKPVYGAGGQTPAPEPAAGGRPLPPAAEAPKRKGSKHADA